MEPLGVNGKLKELISMGASQRRQTSSYILNTLQHLGMVKQLLIEITLQSEYIKE